MKRPDFYNYGWYENSNYGVHTLCFRDAYGDRFWYSYETLVAFQIGDEFHITKNYWGTTTGKHLNWINDNKDIREDAETFSANYERLIAGRKTA